MAPGISSRGSHRSERAHSFRGENRMSRRRLLAHTQAPVREILRAEGSCPTPEDHLLLLAKPRSFSAFFDRVEAPGHPGAPLTEPDLCCSHPALRDGGL